MNHLLQAKRALFASRLVVFIKSVREKIGQKGVFGGLRGWGLSLAFQQFRVISTS